MNEFGFMIGTVLVNTLFVFDVFFSKYQRRWSLWGSTMTFVVEQYNLFLITPIWTLIGLWFGGLLFGNTVNFVQVIMCIMFWAYILVLYVTSTFLYYKWKVPEMKKD